MNSRSIADQLALINTIIYNVKNYPAIRQKLIEWGYPLQKVDEAEAVLNNTLLTQQDQQKSYRDKQSINRRWRTEMGEVRTRYAEHRAVAKTIFRNQPDELARLRLDQPLPRRQSNWLEQMQAFYQEVGESKDMQKLGVKPEELTQTKAMVASLVELRAQRLQCKGSSESATQKRNQALAELTTWRKEFSRVAKMALKDDPQLLEVLGIVVPA
jgi:hypothetical protein